MKITGLPRAAGDATARRDASTRYVYKAYLASSADAAVEVYLADVFPNASGAAKVKVTPEGDLSALGLDRVVITAYSKDARLSFDILSAALHMTTRAALLRVRRLAPVLAVLALPALARAVCAPTARGIFPASGIVGTTVDAVVEGRRSPARRSRCSATPGSTRRCSRQATSPSTSASRSTRRRRPASGSSRSRPPGGTVAVSFTVNQVGGPVVADVSPPLLATTGLSLDAHRDRHGAHRHHARPRSRCRAPA